MLAFLRHLDEGCRTFYANQTTPTKPAPSMKISKKFLEILRLSFEVRYLDENVKLSKKKNKIKALEDRMDVLYNNVNDVSTKFDDIVALAAAYYNIGLERAKSTEICELYSATQCFTKSIDLLIEKQLDPKAILTSIGALNELNSVNQKTETKYKHICTFLSLAQELYLNYTRVSEDYPDPIHIASLVDIKEEESNPRFILDTLHFRTLHDLGVHYLAKPKDKHAFVTYLHDILNFILTKVVSDQNPFEEKHINFALTLFDLSKYFLANDRFIEAKNYIITADYIIYKFFQNKFQTREEKTETQLNPSCENYDHIIAISDISWGFYGVYLLRFWKDKFLQNKENTSCEIQELMSELAIKSKYSKLLIFSDLEKELECMTNQDTKTYISNLVDAKSVFVKTLGYFDTAKKYFSADTNIVSYAKIGLGISNAYKYFAGFVEQRDKRIKLHKRQVECLEDICKKIQELNTTIVDTELQIYKRIWYETVTSCSKVMDLILEETYDDKLFEETSLEVDRYAKLIVEKITFYLNIV